MQVSQVTNDDGRACAQLIRFLNAARWDLTGGDAEELIKCKRWIQDIAGKMAGQLKGSEPAPTPAAPTPATDQTMRIKAMGPLGSSPQKKRKK